ncbi:MAG: tripartite tricarboxylate transporter substrate binding protein [Pseudomonadota bacterium]
MQRRSFSRALAALPAALAALPLSALAQTPIAAGKTVTLLVGYSAGGPVDSTARLLAAALGKEMGINVVVDNRGGASGMLAAAQLARATPDGLTLMMGASPTFAMAPHIQSAKAANPLPGLVPVANFVEYSNVLVMNPGMPIRNMAEFITYAKANPTKLNFGTVGSGSNVHLALELFKLMTKTSFVDVPYKGGAQAMTAMIGGEIQTTAMSVVPSMPHVKSGRVRALAVSTAQRSTYLPDVPAVSETVPGYEASHWYAMWGPKGMPRGIVMRWNQEVSKVLATEEAKARAKAEGMDIGGGTPEYAQQIIARDIEKWRRVIRDAKIKRES